MANKEYKKVPISEELRATAGRWNDLLDEIAGDSKIRLEPFSARFDVLEITAENLERFQAAFQEAGVTNDDVDWLQSLLIRLEEYPVTGEFNDKHWDIACSVSKQIDEWDMNVDAAYAIVANEVDLDKSTVGKIYRKFKPIFD